MSKPKPLMLLRSFLRPPKLIKIISGAVLSKKAVPLVVTQVKKNFYLVAIIRSERSFMNLGLSRQEALLPSNIIILTPSLNNFSRTPSADLKSNLSLIFIQGPTK